MVDKFPKYISKYVPQRGDIVWLTLSPTKGHEQSGRRPGLVISEKEFNIKTGLALVAPISSKSHGYETEVIFKTEKVQGTVLVFQVRTIDWIARDIEFCDKISQELLNKVQNVLVSLIISR